MDKTFSSKGHNDSGLVLALDSSNNSSGSSQASPPPATHQGATTENKNGTGSASTQEKTFSDFEGVLAYNSNSSGKNEKKPLSDPDGQEKAVFDEDSLDGSQAFVEATAESYDPNPSSPLSPPPPAAPLLEPYEGTPADSLDPNPAPPTPPAPSSPYEATMCPLEEENQPSVSEMVGLDPVQDMRRELSNNRAAIFKLEKELRETTSDRERVQEQLEKSKERYDEMVSSKEAEIAKLNDEMGSLRLHISRVEKSNEDQKKNFEAKISELEKELKDKESEHIKEKYDLKIEISKNELEISRMQTLEQSLKRQLAEARQELAEECRKREEECRKRAEERQKQAEENQKKAEASWKRAEERQKQAEASRKREEENRKQAEERQKQAEASRKREEENRKQVERHNSELVERLNSMSSNSSAEFGRTDSTNSATSMSSDSPAGAGT